MFSLTDINTMANKKSIASRMYNHVVNLLETPFFLDGSDHEVGEELLLKDNANQDGFKFACDPDNELFGKTFDGSPENISMEIFPEFYSSHIGMKLVVFSHSGDEMTAWAAKEFMNTLRVEQLNKIAEAMAWLIEAYGKGIVNGDGTIEGYVTEYKKK